MGRKAQGWKFVEGRDPLTIRFRHEGQRYTLSTGTSDPGAAAEEAARLYSDVVHGRRRRVTRARRAVSGDLEVLFAEWLAAVETTLDPETLKTYETTYVGTHWLGRWKTLGELHDASVAEYARARLGKVIRSTVQKELSALYGFFDWCVEQKWLDETEVPRRPRLGRKVTGTRSGPQRETAPDFAPEQVEAFLAALPEWSASLKVPPFPIRARFIVAYETGLRPATLDALTWGDWTPEGLRIRKGDDKARRGRVVPLSARAYDALRALNDEDENATPKRLIFGEHDYRNAFAKASAEVGIEPAVSPYDFRHNRITHSLEAGANIPGVMFQVGHTQLATTSKYTKPTRRAAEAAIEASSGSVRDQQEGQEVRRAGVEPARVISSLEPESGAMRCSSEETPVCAPQNSAGKGTASQALGSGDPVAGSAESEALGKPGERTDSPSEPQADRCGVSEVPAPGRACVDCGGPVSPPYRRCVNCDHDPDDQHLGRVFGDPAEHEPEEDDGCRCYWDGGRAFCPVHGDPLEKTSESAEAAPSPSRSARGTTSSPLGGSDESGTSPGTDQRPGRVRVGEEGCLGWSHSLTAGEGDGHPPMPPPPASEGLNRAARVALRALAVIHGGRQAIEVQR